MTASRWGRIKEIYASALESPERERSRFVQHACGGDEDLRREVERLLAEPAASDFMKSGLGSGNTLAPGHMVAHYRLVAKIGEGGMGEVYRASDTKLGRSVAIKILPPTFAGDPDRMARFRREAQVLASLNHPNIAAIYGVEDRALVMELVEGETLHGPLPVPSALNYARQITDALDYAHEKGVIHRDLKPANIKITPDGIVKILDFGLAKIAEPPPASGSPANSPNLIERPTEAGLILGTAGYMAPEQARGQPVDRRADIWAFGVVLYEMLTGRRLFTGDSVSDTLAAVLTKDPDWSLLPKDTPANVGRLLHRCLERDRKKRLRDLGDAWTEPDPVPAERSVAPGSKRLPWVAAALFGSIALVAVWAPWRAVRTVPDRSSLRFLIDVEVPVAYLAVSPDGMRVVLTKAGREGGTLLTRRLDEESFASLPGTEDAMYPFFSPDGQWLAFFARGKLRKTAVGSGVPMTLCDAPNGRGGSWGEDGYIVAALDVTGGLSRVPSSSGGKPEMITGLHGEVEDATSHRWPLVLPRGKGIIFTALSGQMTALWVLKPGSTHPRLLRQNAREARYLENGHLVYYNQGSIIAAPMDLDRLELTGPGVSLVSGVPLHSGYHSLFDLAMSGTLVHLKGWTEARRVVSWIDSMGRIEPLLSSPGRYLTPRLSPNGKRLAITIEQSDGANVWVYDRNRETMTPMPAGAEYQFHPVWTPDGEYLVFQSGGKLAWARSDGSGRVEYLAGTRQPFPNCFSSDGRRLFFHQATAGNYDVWDVAMEKNGARPLGQPRRLGEHPDMASHPAISPDGKWLAWSTQETRRLQVYVVALAPDGRPGGGKWRVSTGSGTQPVWSRNGRDLFYLSPQGIMAVSYSSKGNVFVPEKPRLWSDKRLSSGTGQVVYDVAADGKRVVALLDAESEPPKAETHLHVMLNVGEELRRRAAAASGKQP